jgi:hypothetical protein
MLVPTVRQAYNDKGAESLSERCDMLWPMAQKKNPNAVALGRLGGKASMDGKSQEQREDFARAGGKAGGPARAKALSPKRRKEIAKKAAAARWGLKAAKKKAAK